MPDDLTLTPLDPGDTSPWEEIGNEHHAYAGGNGSVRYGLVVRSTRMDKFGNPLPAKTLEAEVTVFDAGHPDNWRPHSWRRVRSVHRQPFPTVEDGQLWCVARAGVMLKREP